MQMTFFAIFTDDGLDQMVETLTLANREAKSLRAMGCKVIIKQMTETAAEAFAEKISIRGYL